MATKYRFRKGTDTRIHQGDIFKNVRYFESYEEKNREFQLNILQFPYAIILTQECDLEHNFNEREKIKGSDSTEIIAHDKFLVSLLCAPLYNAEQIYTGNHLSEIKIRSSGINSKQKEYVKQNRDPRYHYFELDEDIGIVPSIIDFKHYFSISVNYLESRITDRICSIDPIFRELISQRFSNYLSRIGLPEPNTSSG